MIRFKYEITTHSAEQFKTLAYFCSETGECDLKAVSHEQTRLLNDILNIRGGDGWELVQLLFGKDGVMAVWKQPLST